MPNERLPDLPPPPGESFRFLPLPSAAFGITSFKLKLAGGPMVKQVRLFVDGARQGDAMVALGHGMYTQEVDTSFCLDGIHEVAAAGVDKGGQIVLTTFAKVDFRNVERLELINVQPNEDATGYWFNVVVHAIRVPVPREAFSVIDRAGPGGEREVLPVAEIEYSGDVQRGNRLPVARLRAQRTRGARLSAGAHRVTVAINDQQGFFRANASTTADVSE